MNAARFKILPHLRNLAGKWQRMTTSVSETLHLNTRNGKIGGVGVSTLLAASLIFYPRRVPDDVIYRTQQYGLHSLYDGEVMCHDLSFGELTSRILRYTLSSCLLKVTLPLHRGLQLVRMNRPFDTLLEYAVAPLYSGGLNAMEVGAKVPNLADKFVNVCVQYVTPWASATLDGDDGRPAFPVDHLPYDENLDVEAERTVALLEISEDLPNISSVTVLLSSIFPPPLLKRLNTILGAYDIATSQNHVDSTKLALINNNPDKSNVAKACDQLVTMLTADELEMFTKGLDRLLVICESARSIGTPVVLGAELNIKLGPVVNWMWSRLATVYNRTSPVVFLEHPVVSPTLDALIAHAQTHNYILALVLSSDGTPDLIEPALDSISKADVSAALVVHTHSIQAFLALDRYRSPGAEHRLPCVLMCDYGRTTHLLEAAATEGVPCIMKIPYGSRESVLTWLIERVRLKQKLSHNVVHEEDVATKRIMVLEWWRRLGFSFY